MNVDKSKWNALDNFKMIRRFHGGKDEQWFVMIHSCIDSETGKLVKSNHEILEGASKNDLNLMCTGLNNLADIMEYMYQTFIQMWERSDPTR